MCLVPTAKILGNMSVASKPGYYTLVDSAPLFNELWDMFVGFLGLQAILLLELKNVEAREIFRKLRESPSDEVDENFIRGTPFYIRELDCDDVFAVFHAPDLLEHISKPKQLKPSKLTFQIFEKPAWDSIFSGRPVIVGTHQPSYFESIWGYVLAAAYERNQTVIRKAHSKKRGGRKDFLDWPPTLQFFRHIRNGLYHGGKFEISPGTIDPKVPPRWRHYVMPSESDMRGRSVFSDFLKLPHVPVLIHDMSLELANCSAGRAARP